MEQEIIKNFRRFVSWKIVFHVGASSFYLYLITTTYSSGANVMLVERMVTTWYLTVHIGFIFMALGLDFIRLYAGESSKMAGYIATFNNIIFISVVFPFGLFVPLTYWSLFYYNSNLILPNVVEITVPNWVSTSSHSIISLVVVVEMVTTKYTYKGNYIAALTTLAVFSVSYIMCLIRTYVQFGFWVYPVLHMVPEDELWMVFLALAAKVVVLFFAGAGISFLIHEHDSDNRKSNSLENQKKSNSVNSAIKSVPDKAADSSSDEGKPPPFTLKFKSSQNSTLPKQLRDFSIANGHKIDESPKNDPETWHDAVYSPAVASFMENSGRKVPKPKKMYRRRIGNIQKDVPRKMHETQNPLISVFLKTRIRDDQQMTPVLMTENVSKPWMRDDQRVVLATSVEKMQENLNHPNNLVRSSTRDDKPAIPVLEGGKMRESRNYSNNLVRSSTRNDQPMVPAPAVGKMHENRNRPNNFYRFSIPDDQQVIPATAVEKIHENQNRPNVSKLPIRDQPAVSAPMAAQGCCRPATKPSFLLSDRMNEKVDETDRDLSMANIPAPIIEDELPMDSLETPISTPPPSLIPPPKVLENERRKMKKLASLRKEKSRSNISLSSEDFGVESKSVANALPSRSPPKTKRDKEPVPESSKIDACVMKKKDKKKKEDKGPKRISKDPVKKSLLADTRSDGWTYREITSRRGAGKLDMECLDFETQSLPANVDREIDGKKHD